MRLTLTRSDFQLAAVGHSVAVSKQVKAGLGQHVTSLTSLQVQAFQQVCLSNELLLPFKSS